MKKVLITGTSGYVGKSLISWTEKHFNGEIVFDTISLRSEMWKTTSFSDYDTILHLAGMAHINETKNNSHLFYSINYDLTLELALKARREGVKHFIFLSSMSVFGAKEGIINLDTVENPNTHYGKSKLKAEYALKEMENETFKLCIVRPPMIYGENSPGNYSRLSKVSKIIPFYPKLNNYRSMIFIDNLSRFLFFLIKEQKEGIYFPQNKEYIQTLNIIKEIRNLNSKKTTLIKLPGFNLLVRNNSLLSKVFGTLTYDKEISEFSLEPYASFTEFNESIRQSEGKC